MNKAWWDFSTKKALVIGDVMLDRYWSGSCRRVSPEAPVPVVNVQNTEARLGGAANTAANLAALKMPCTLIGAIGEDEAGEILQKLCQEQGIQFEALKIKGFATTTKLRLISQGQQLARMDFEEQCVSQQKRIEAYLLEHIHSFDIVILSDYAKGLLTDCNHIIRIIRQYGVPVFVDPKVSDYRVYNGATLVKPNFTEFTQIVGPCPDEQTIARKGALLRGAHDFEHLLVTRGAEGMTLLERDSSPIHLPTHATEVFDVSGAGDTVMAVLAAVYASGSVLERAAQIANIGAGVVVAKEGTAVLSLAELKAAVNGYHRVVGAVVSEAQLLNLVKSAKQAGQRVVMTNGCFDILHAGHAMCLQQAAAFGDRLIVAVNTDDSVRRLKGPMRPLNAVEDRMSLLASLGCVDWVVAFDEDTPKALIEKVLPDVLVKGGDYQVSEIVGADAVLSAGGEVQVIQLLEGRSTTSTINKIKQTEQEAESL